MKLTLHYHQYYRIGGHYTEQHKKRIQSTKLRSNKPVHHGDHQKYIYIYLCTSLGSCFICKNLFIRDGECTTQ
jgi:hypothetical protein